MHFVGSQRLVFPNAPGAPPLTPEVSTIDSAIRATILHQASAYPCVAAIRSLVRNDYCIGLYGSLDSNEHSAALREDLISFILAQRRSNSLYQTMWAVFPDTTPMDELELEAALWSQLSSLTSEALREHDWKDQRQASPASREFVFSIAGEPLFVVGVHPASPRPSRRFSYVALVFNLFRQFEALEDNGAYDAMVKTNRKRAIAFDGNINPMVERYGDDWEAIQYSGRNNGPEWKCPFHFAASTKD